MALAGLRQRPMRGDRVSLETLLVRAARGPAAQRLSAGPIFERPALARPSGCAPAERSRIVATDGRRWTCMGPLLIDEIERLRRALR